MTRRGGGRITATILVVLVLMGVGLADALPAGSASIGLPVGPAPRTGPARGVEAGRPAGVLGAALSLPEGRIALVLNGSPTRAGAPLVANFSAQVSAVNASSFVVTWDFADGSPNQTFPLSAVDGNASMRTNHTFTTPGNYTVNVSASDNAGDSATSATLPIRVAAAFVVTINTTPAHAVVGKAVVITPNATGGVPPYHVAWTGVPADCFAGNANLTCVPAAPGNYSVRVSVSDSTVDRFSEDVFIVAAPRLFVTAAYQSAFSCQSAAGVAVYNFTTTTSGGDPPVNYTWTIGNGLGPAYGPAVTLSLPLNETFVVSVVAVDAAGEQATSSVTFSTSFPRCGAVPPPNYTPPRWLLVAGVTVAVLLVALLIFFLWRTERGRRPPRPANEAVPPGAWNEGATAPRSGPGNVPAEEGPPPWKE